MTQSKGPTGATRRELERVPPASTAHQEVHRLSLQRQKTAAKTSLLPGTTALNLQKQCKGRTERPRSFRRGSELHQTARSSAGHRHPGTPVEPDERYSRPLHQEAKHFCNRATQIYSVVSHLPESIEECRGKRSPFSGKNPAELREARNQC